MCLALWAGTTSEAVVSRGATVLEENNDDTDNDLGIHGLIGGDPWKKLKIKGPNGRRLLDISLENRLSQATGIDRTLLRECEPNFDELEPGIFFERFPAGEYEIKGRTILGREIESKAELSHVLPAAPGNLTINGIPARPLARSMTRSATRRIQLNWAIPL